MEYIQAFSSALLFGPLTLYLNVASAAILVRLVGVTELGEQQPTNLTEIMFVHTDGCAGESRPYHLLHECLACVGGVLLCLGSVEQAGHVTGWLTFHYLFPLLLRHRMPGVAFLATGFLLLVPSTIFGSASPSPSLLHT